MSQAFRPIYTRSQRKHVEKLKSFNNQSSIVRLDFERENLQSQNAPDFQYTFTVEPHRLPSSVPRRIVTYEGFHYTNSMHEVIGVRIDLAIRAYIRFCPISSR